MVKNSKIFIAGGTGFLGKRVTKRCKEKGLNFTATSLSLGVDFRDIEQIKKYFEKEKPDFVINCAAFVGGIQFGYKHPGEIFYNNTLISTNLIECSRLFNVKRFVNPISNCTYPDFGEKSFKEENWWDGEIHESVFAYACVRKASYVQTWAYNRQYGMDSVNLILPNMYGPDDHFEEERSHALGALIKKIVDAKRNNEPSVNIWGTGKPVREWLYVDDGVEAVMKALGIKPIIEPINIGQGQGISIKDLAYLIKEITGYKGELVFDHKKPDGAPYKVMDVEKCKKIFGWIPKTGLKEGIRKTIEWYKNKNS